MLNVRSLNGLLTENTDTKLFPRWFIMTPNGSLIAYSTPANIRDLRDQIALISMTWKEQLDQRLSSSATTATSDNAASNHTVISETSHSRPPIGLETLTLEFDRRNVLVRYLQPRLLLVLEGGVPRGRRRPLKVTSEAPGESRYPPPSDSDNFDGSDAGQQYGSPSAESQASTAISSAGTAKRMGVLDVHRRKLDALAKRIVEEFERSGFIMPEEGGDKFF